MVCGSGQYGSGQYGSGQRIVEDNEHGSDHYGSGQRTVEDDETLPLVQNTPATVSLSALASSPTPHGRMKSLDPADANSYQPAEKTRFGLSHLSS